MLSKDRVSLRGVQGSKGSNNPCMSFSEVLRPLINKLLISFDIQRCLSSRAAITRPTLCGNQHRPTWRIGQYYRSHRVALMTMVRPVRQQESSSCRKRRRPQVAAPAIHVAPGNREYVCHKFETSTTHCAPQIPMASTRRAPPLTQLRAVMDLLRSFADRCGPRVHYTVQI
jgi:hypothetical protein